MSDTKYPLKMHRKTTVTGPPSIVASLQKASNITMRDFYVLVLTAGMMPVGGGGGDLAWLRRYGPGMILSAEKMAGMLLNRCSSSKAVEGAQEQPKP